MRASTKRIIWPLWLLLLPSLWMIGCNKGGDDEGSGQGEAASQAGPADVGEQIASVFRSAMQDLRTLVASQPEPAALRPQLDALKEATIQQLLPLGRQLQAADEAERSRANSTVMSAFRELDREVGMDWLNEALSHYRPLDNDLANEIASFNTITQYAFFDLLCRQNAEEAQRLGVTCD